MPTAIAMPKLGLTMTEGVLSQWMVQPGQKVQTGEVIFVVETDKIASDVEAPTDGTIGELVASEGDTVEVGGLLGYWSDGGAPLGEIDAPAPEATASTPAREPVANGHAEGERMLATPLARRIASERGIDLSVLRGSGPRGRIKAADVDAAAARATDTRPSPPASSPSATVPKVNAAPVAGAPSLGSGAPDAVGGVRRPANQIEKIVACRMVEAKTTIPHFYVLTDVDVTDLLKFRKELNADPASPKASLNHLIVKAVGAALVAMPESNIVWHDGEFLQLANPDVGIAVDTPRGLLAPVLRGAGQLSLDRLVEGTNALIESARDGRLASDALTGGAVSVSNVGMFGASHLVPIVNPGQSSILGVGASKQVFRPDAEGNPVLRQEVGMVLSCDHRVLNGVSATKFLDLIKRYLEAPMRLLRS